MTINVIEIFLTILFSAGFGFIIGLVVGINEESREDGENNALN